ncbi:inositol monophosphatase family protein [Erythrobacter sp. R86502]|uniref:inositol monophosphatase family protein n=1 Tax=Erythrobacter sp. R86502 TaxID=3093846 RepID=UPI0036D3836A
MNASLDKSVSEALREAARVAILPRFAPGRPIDADFKVAGEAVTAADRESEQILHDRLAALIPGAHVVGEEAVHFDPALSDLLSQGTCWIIDPLDGTGNFAKGLAPFGMLVALAEHGRPVAGWIYDPVTDRLCSAHRGRGAFVDGQPFRSPLRRGGRPTVAVTRLFAQPERRDALIDVLAGRFDVVDSPRCAADQYPRVAAGGNDATLFTRTIAWDHAAGVVFVEEAGGVARRQDGTAYHCGAPDSGLVIASCQRRWDDVALCLDTAGVLLAGAHLA